VIFVRVVNVAVMPPEIRRLKRVYGFVVVKRPNVEAGKAKCERAYDGQSDRKRAPPIHQICD